MSDAEADPMPCSTPAPRARLAVSCAAFNHLSKMVLFQSTVSVFGLGLDVVFMFVIAWMDGSTAVDMSAWSQLLVWALLQRLALSLSQEACLAPR
jgi:hypothetical protein